MHAAQHDLQISDESYDPAYLEGLGNTEGNKGVVHLAPRAPRLLHDCDLHKRLRGPPNLPIAPVFSGQRAEHHREPAHTPSNIMHKLNLQAFRCLSQLLHRRLATLHCLKLSIQASQLLLQYVSRAGPVPAGTMHIYCMATYVHV